MHYTRSEMSVRNGKVVNSTFSSVYHLNNKHKLFTGAHYPEIYSWNKWPFAIRKPPSLSLHIFIPKSVRTIYGNFQENMCKCPLRTTDVSQSRRYNFCNCHKQEKKKIMRILAKNYGDINF